MIFITTYSHSQWLGLYLGPFVASLLYLIPGITQLPNDARSVLAITTLVVIWWITEPIPMAFTSLLPFILLPFFSDISYYSTAISYFDPLILMFLGGFTIALSIEKWNVHKRMALWILLIVGTTSKRILLGMMIATSFLSMWISNAATALMMLPVALALVTEVQQKNLFDLKSFQSFSKSLLLIIAYSASIGGLATLIGSVPNAVFTGVVKKVLKTEITFATWFLFAFPITVVLLTLLFLYIVKRFPVSTQAKIPKTFVINEISRLGKLSQEEKKIFFVFLVTIGLWIFSDCLPFRLTDTSIALLGAVSLLLLPANKGTILTLRDLLKLPWSILLLFGGGLSIASAFVESGLTIWVTQHLSNLSNLPYLLILFIFALTILFMTEIMSNTAISNVFIPLSISISTVIGVEAYGLMALVALCSTCAFMLPVSTPPNAVVYGTSYLSSQDMIKTGLRMNLLAVFVIVAAVYLWLPQFLH